MINLAMTNLSGYQTYQKSKYETASPHKLILLMFDGALSNIKQASAAFDKSDHVSAHNRILKVQDILYELISCINEDQGGQIARNLKDIYLYCIQQLVQANLRKDGSILVEVGELLKDLREAWANIGKEVSLGKRT